MRENEPVADTPDFSLLMHEIKLWLQHSGPFKNRWFSDGKISVYLRRSERKFNPEMQRVPVVDLANVTVEQELRSRGVFKSFIEAFERSVDRPIFVENVLNSRFQRFWIARGYQPDAYHEFCYWGPPVR